MRRVSIVTGAAGFIGSHLVERLLAEDHRVIGVDNLRLGTRANLAGPLADPRFGFVEVDLSEASAVARVASVVPGGAPVEVWHLAANSDIRASELTADLRDTFQTTIGAVALARRLKAERLYFASSSAIYGEHDGPLREDTGPLLPISPYGAMKLASEAVISAAAEAYLPRVDLLRFPNVVGARATHGAIYDFIARLRARPERLEVLGDGTQLKPYLHVGDLIEAMRVVSRADTPRRHVLNIGQPATRTSVRYMAERTRDRVAPGAELVFGAQDRGWVGDVPRFEFVVERALALGWRPRLDSDGAVDRAIVELA